MVDYYQLLGVDSKATLDQIGQRYRFLAHAYHPDKFASEQHKTEAAEAFKQINEAFTTLSNQQLRAAYDSKREYFGSLDQRRRSPPPPEPAQPKPPPDPPKPQPQPKTSRDVPPREKPSPPPKDTPKNTPKGGRQTAPKNAPGASPLGKTTRRGATSRKWRWLAFACLIVAVILLAVPADVFNRRDPTLTIVPLEDTTASEHPRAGAESSPPVTVFTNSLGMKLALVPAGEYLIGSPDSEPGYHGKHEMRERQRPVHIAQPFMIGVYAVTQAQYETVMGRNPSHFSKSGIGKEKIGGQDTSRFPVEKVSWYDAVEFCNKLSERERRSDCYRLANVHRTDEAIDTADVTNASGRGYRLPTEAEWECACRAGTATPFHFGTSLNGEKANCNGYEPYGTTTLGPFLDRTTAVGSYPPNAWRLYDMHGNVRQWCQDGYDEGVSGKPPPSDAQGPTSRKYRVIRGGGFFDSAVYCRSAYCFKNSPDFRSYDLGFRVVLAGE